MSSVPHAVPSRMTHTVAALFGHADDTLIAWQQACVQAAAALQPPPDPERLAKALALAQCRSTSRPQRIWHPTPARHRRARPRRQPPRQTPIRTASRAPTAGT